MLSTFCAKSGEAAANKIMMNIFFFMCSTKVANSCQTVVGGKAFG